MNFDITPAQLCDAAEILALQHLAYQSEALLYNAWNIPPLTQNLEELQNDFHVKIVLKACDSGRIIGSVRGTIRDETACIKRLIVHPDYQRQGIGGALMTQIEHCFDAATRIELFTGEKSESNIRLYRKLGYEIFKREAINPNLTFVWMEKLISPKIL